MSEDRLNILRLLEKGKISAEEAEHILAETENESQRIRCHTCVYNQDNLESDETEKDYLH